MEAGCKKSSSTSVSRSSNRLRLGFFLIGDGQWRGGLNYQRTLIETIANKLPDQIEVRVFVTKDQFALAIEAFGKFLDQPPVVDSRAAGAGTGWRAFKAIVLGSDRPTEKLMYEHNIDVVFETARFFGQKFSLPCLSWLPDFQHRSLPHLFNTFGWWRREIGFRAQTQRNSLRTIILSSKDAQDSCEQYYPESRGRTRVVRFAPEIDLKKVQEHIETARTLYGIPKTFFYLPNQFWAHKNHSVVIAALRQMRQDGSLSTMPPIMMSGPTEDYRKNAVFEETMAVVKAEGFEPWLKHLGLIPFRDVLALNAGATALLNPSKFEGWASSVEEAKALGTPLILSDIPVHQEQAPDAQFFDPDDAQGLAKILRTIAENPSLHRQKKEALEIAIEKRLAEFTLALKNALANASHLRANE